MCLRFIPCPGWWPMLLATVLLAACSGRNAGESTSRTVASVGNQSISRPTYEAFVQYTIRFYQRFGANGQAVPSRCAPSSHLVLCHQIRAQVLARMLQEQVVLNYADEHHIILTSSDWKVLKDEANNLKAPSGGNVPMPSAMGVGEPVLLQVLARQMLVQRVENAVAPDWAKKGPSVHVVRFFLPFTAESKRLVYQQAVHVAVEGRSNSSVAWVRTQWMAVFRLPAEVRRDLQFALPGLFIGPFRMGSTYIVMKVVGRAKRLFAKPARSILEARYFAGWLQNRLRASRISCFGPAGQQAICPAFAIKQA